MIIIFVSWCKLEIGEIKHIEMKDKGGFLGECNARVIAEATREEYEQHLLEVMPNSSIKLIREWDEANGYDYCYKALAD